MVESKGKAYCDNCGKVWNIYSKDDIALNNCNNIYGKSKCK